MCMRSRTVIGATLVTGILGIVPACSTAQHPAARSVDETILREYTGAYQWGPDAFLYLHLWNEFTGANQLVAFDESGDVRTLYPLDRDRFSAGSAAAAPTAIESRVEFQRDASGRTGRLPWRKEGASPRIARRV